MRRCGGYLVWETLGPVQDVIHYWSAFLSGMISLSIKMTLFKSSAYVYLWIVRMYHVNQLHKAYPTSYRQIS
jgi:hypothetical protein